MGAAGPRLGRRQLRLALLRNPRTPAQTALPLLTNPRLEARTRHALTKGVEFLRSTQLKEAPWTGAWTRAAETLPADHPGLPDSFNRRATEIRIDYVQHALSALLMYETLIQGH